MTPGLWADLKRHFEHSEDMFISSSRESCVKKGDIIFVYEKNIIASKKGFVCIVQTKTAQIKNIKYKIFPDQNLNKYCFGVDTVSIFDKVMINDINGPLCSIESYKNKASFAIRFLKYDSIFTALNNDIGYCLLENILRHLETLPDIDDEEHEKDPHNQTDPLTEGSDDSTEVSVNANANDQTTEVEIEYGNIPVMVVLCEKALNSIVNEPDNEPSVIHDHMINCKACDITDNGNCIPKLLQIWNETTIIYEEGDSNYDELTNCLESYYSLKKFNPSTNLKTSQIKLLNIIDQDHIYNNCMIILSYISEMICEHDDAKDIKKKTKKKK